LILEINRQQGSGRRVVSKPSVDAKSRKKDAQKRGRWAEWLTRQYLRASGRRILAKNFKTPLGEIDIVAQKGRLISFIEVKTRTDYSALADAVGAAQQNRIGRAAQLFLQHHPDLQSCDVRFDVALVHNFRISYIENAWP
jgi:putative endonuclease